MRKQDDVLVEVEGHFWWLEEDIPEGNLPLTAQGFSYNHDKS